MFFNIHFVFAAVAFAGIAIRAKLRDVTAAEDEDEDDELLFASFVIRHGARGPTKKALYLACGETAEQRMQRNDPNSEPHPATSASKIWKPEELEALTTVGSDQLVALGAHFAKYIRRIKCATNIKLRRSEAPRVIASAISFMKGYELSKNLESPRLEYTPYNTVEENVAVFRSWTGTEYNRHIARLKHSKIYQEKGEASAAILDATVLKLCKPWSSDLSRAGQLNLTTYLWECKKCEEYFPNSFKRQPGSISHYFKERPDACEGLRKLALWCFDQRFINRQTVGDQWGMHIGGDILQEIHNDFLISGGRGGASVYIGHDYTILALMSALGVIDHPPSILGFGAYAIMEYRRKKETGTIYQRLLIQTTPFPDLNHPSKVVSEIDDPPVEVFSTSVGSYNELH
jgi:hypothetical protein